MDKKVFIFVWIAVLLVCLVGCAGGPTLQVNTPVPNAKAGTPAPNDRIDVPGVSIQVDAPGPNPLANKPDAHGQIAGILQGLWHGIISPVTLVLSFVNKDVYMYEVHNDGSPYNLGFLLGFMILLAVVIGIGSRRR